MRLAQAVFTLYFMYNALANDRVKYEPTWESIDSRPLPEWYDEAKIGIFIHWGVFSVPSYGSEWFWQNWITRKVDYVQFMAANYEPSFTYQEFAKEFKAEFFDPKFWAELFQKSGAKYVVLTSKHHEGYTLWPSKYSFGWNAKDIGPNKDLVGALANAVHKHTNLKFGVYHSLYEWYNPMYMSDRISNFKNNTFVVNKMYPEMVELVEKYHPEIIWSDGEWDAPYTYWKSTEFLSWLYNESPVRDTVVVNDRWGSGDIICKHGGFFTCKDRYNPGVLQTHKWENAMTIDKESWGYRRNAKIEDYLTIHKLLVTLTQTVTTGGNILINVGPTSSGIISPIFQERLLQLGKWLSINGEAIYRSKPWIYQNDTISNVWYTAKENAVYAITTEWPSNSVLELGRVSSLFDNAITLVTLLGNTEQLQWNTCKDTVSISFPDKAIVKSEWVWVIKIKGPYFVPE